MRDQVMFWTGFAFFVVSFLLNRWSIQNLDEAKRLCTEALKELNSK